MQVVAAASAWCPNAQLVTATAVAAPPASPAAAAAPEPGEQRSPRPATLQGWGELLRENSGASALGAPFYCFFGAVYHCCGYCCACGVLAQPGRAVRALWARCAWAGDLPH